MPERALRPRENKLNTSHAAQSRRQLRAPSPSDPYLPGEVISDRYRLTHELGRGGMGVVWLAHSLVLGIDVALKLIQTDAANTEVGSRMAQEAHAAARLGHPALVRVFDFGWTARGDPYLVMELVHGETLADQLRREVRVTALQAVRTLLPIADGLRLAHDRGIVHRDLKPANIILATDALGRTQPKLLDFGIAKVDCTPTLEGRLTQQGVVLGSPEYMSPEQALGKDDIDGRTDVWSLSVVLYEMVTGSIPFNRPNYNALMQAILHEEAAPLPMLSAGNATLWPTIRRGMAKRPEQRWADMTEFGEALALWLYERGVKEDLSGNSVRAVWLEGVLSGLRIEVPCSAAPEGEQETPPKPVAVLGPPPPASEAGPEDSTGETPAGRKPRGHPGIRWALALVAAIAPVAVLAWPRTTQTRAADPSPIAIRKPAAAQARPQVMDLRQQSTNPVDTGPIAPQASTDKADEKPAEAAAATQSDKAVPPAAKANRPRAKTTRPTKRRSPRGSVPPIDFGF